MYLLPVQDFHILENANYLHVEGALSPSRTKDSGQVPNFSGDKLESLRLQYVE